MLLQTKAFSQAIFPHQVIKLQRWPVPIKIAQLKTSEAVLATNLSALIVNQLTLGKLTSFVGVKSKNMPPTNRRTFTNTLTHVSTFSMSRHFKFTQHID